MSAARGGIGLSLILSAVVTLVSLLGVELVFRRMQGVPVSSTENFVVTYLDIIRANGGAITHDPLLGWRLTDNLQEAGFNTGAHGVRMNDRRRRNPPTGAILAVGDSFTAGSGVRDNQTWPAQLERTLGKPVLNAASGGWAVDQMVLRAEQLAEFLKPSMVVVGILAVDSFRNAFRIWGGGHKPLFMERANTLELTNVPTERLNNRPMRLGLARRLFGHSYVVHWSMLRFGQANRWAGDHIRYERVHDDKTAVRISCLLMDRLVRLKDQGSRVVVVMLYGAGEAERPAPWYGTTVLECAAKRGFDTVDTHPALHALANTDRSRFLRLWLDEGGQPGHMSPAGNRLISDLLSHQIFGVEQNPEQQSSEGGKNLFENSEALEEVLDSTAHAEVALFKAVKNRNEFRVSARGGKGEHYVVSAPITIAGGAHTLTMEVKSEHVGELRLQLMDAKAVGIIGDFRFRNQTPALAQVGGGQAQQPSATIEPLPDDWYRLRFSATLPEGQIRLILQLGDTSGSYAFLPSSEAVIIRAVQLERGGQRSEYHPALERTPRW